MSIPGFTAEASLGKATWTGFTPPARTPSRSVAAIPQAMGDAFGGFGGFGPTLPTCRWEKQWVDCGSALPGYPVPKCLEWVYVCKFPGSSRNVF
jgi:hypothetical protein